MRLLSNLETGLIRGPTGKIVWEPYKFDRSACGNGCTMWSFGPFYFTILRGDCR